MNCPVCSEKVERNCVLKVSCDDCKGLFHGACVNIFVQDIEYMKNSGTPFRCDKCAVLRPRSLNLPSSSLVNKQIEPKKSAIPAKNTTKNIIEEPNSIEPPANFTLQMVYMKLSNLEEINKEFLSTLTELREENAILKSKINTLESRLNWQQQNTLKNCIEITGLSDVNSNNSNIKAQNIFRDALGIEIADNQIIKCYVKNVYNKNGTNGNSGASRKSIICMELSDFALKQRIMQEKKKKKQNLHSCQYGNSTNSSNTNSSNNNSSNTNSSNNNSGSKDRRTFVFINDALTKYNQALLMRAKEINYGQKYNKDELIRQILDTIAPEIFIPHYWRTEKHCIVFFVDDFRIAEILQSSDRNIQMYDGFKLPVRVRPGTPQVVIDEPYKEKIKLAMVKRYNVNTRALDLSRFHTDPDFKSMFFSLSRPQIMSAVLDIIEKNIPDLVALNLNDNQMVTMESFKNMTQRLPHLNILYLDENRIPTLAHLLVFRNANITELALKSNPLRSRYKDQSTYISEVRKKFPKLTKLDGNELEPQILFDVNDTASLPQPKASFLCDSAGADIIRQFLEQYFIIFDSDNRQPLLDAYHEQAMLSIALPPISQSGRLSAFSKFNHNLKWLNMNNDSDKTRLLKYGRLPVVSTFTEWPKTQHDPQSFTVDLTLFTPKLISFTVAGLFKEFNVDSGASTSHNSSNNNNTEIRYFQRQLVIVPAGGGFCIRNELIFLTSANYSQIKKAFKPVAVAPVTSSPVGLPPIPVAGGLQNRLQVNQPSTSQAAAAMMAPQIAAGSIIPDETTKLQMIQAMSAQSNMNLEWSRKCLEETNWDYNHAAFVFDKLQKESKIPPEAFVK